MWFFAYGAMISPRCVRLLRLPSVIPELRVQRAVSGIHDPIFLLLDPGSSPGRHGRAAGTTKVFNDGFVTNKCHPGPRLFFAVVPELRLLLVCHPGTASAASSIRDPRSDWFDFDPIFFAGRPRHGNLGGGRARSGARGDGRPPRVRADRRRSGPTRAARDRPEGGPGREPRPPAERSRGSMERVFPG